MEFAFAGEGGLGAGGLLLIDAGTLGVFEGNRIIYLLGHLTAVHDAMIPLLRVGERLYPELADVFIKKPDRAVADHPPLRTSRTSGQP